MRRLEKLGADEINLKDFLNNKHIKNSYWIINLLSTLLLIVCL